MEVKIEEIKKELNEARMKIIEEQKRW